MTLPHQHLQSFLKKYNRYNPIFNCITSLNPDLFSHFNTATNSQKSTHNTKPFLLLKDCFETPQWPSTLGTHKSIPHQQQQQQQDSFYTQLCRHFIPVAKTTTPPFNTNIQTIHSVSGYCRNPYNLNCTSGGSSGGSAVGVKLKLAPYALASDMAGSVRIPASFNGIVGLKSRHFGLEAHYPNVTQEEANEILHWGWFAEDVNGMERLMGILRDGGILKDSDDSGGQEQQQQGNNTTTTEATDAESNSMKLLMSPYFSQIPTDYRIRKTFEDAISKLSQHNVSVNQLTDPPFNLNEMQLTFKNLSEGLSFAIFSKRQEIIGTQNPMKHKRGVQPKHIRNQEHIREKIDEILAEYDAWVLPVTPCLPFPHNPKGLRTEIFTDPHTKKEYSYWKNTIYVIPASVSNHTVLTIPLGMTEGHAVHENSHSSRLPLPVGCQIIGRDIDSCLRVGRKMERILGKIDTPNVEENIELFYKNNKISSM